jgi:hypothetical protein
VGQLLEAGAVVRVEQQLFSRTVWNAARSQILSMLEDYHELRPLKPGAPMEEVRQVVPGSIGPKIADALLQEMASCEEVVLRAGEVARWGFEPALSQAQKNLRNQLWENLSEAGLTPPDIKELSAMQTDQADVEGILRLMEADGAVVNIDGAFFFQRTAIEKAGRAVVAALGGETGLGPADFKKVLPVSRRHLLPILRYFDLTGVTTRKGDGRDVASAVPADWGTLEYPGK